MKERKYGNITDNGQQGKNSIIGKIIKKKKGPLRKSCLNQDPRFKKGLPRPTSGVRMSRQK